MFKQIIKKIEIRQLLLIVISLCICIVSFLYDYFTPLGVAGGLIYIIFILTSLWFRSNHIIFIFASISTVLTIAAYFYLNTIEGIPDSVILLNRGMTILVIWIVAYLTFLIKQPLNKAKEFEGAHQLVLDENVDAIKALEASENKLRAITDNTVDGLITITEKGAVETFNKACETIFGYDAEEVIGQNIKMLMPEPYHSEHDGYLQNYHDTGEKKIIGIGRSVEGKRKDGSVFPMDLSVSEVNIAGERYYSGIVRDITEQQKAIEQQEALFEQLVQSNTELERFAYVASHDLQEPLRMVSNFTALLKKHYEEELDERAAEYINISNSSARRMQELVNDLLEYARIGSDEKPPEQVDVAEVMKIVEINLEQHIKNTNASITYDILPIITINPTHLMRLLQNLIGNALKYQADNNEPSIELIVKRRGDAWLFAIKDNGIGMKQEYCKKIFEPFKRLHGTSEYAGTGMGLAICRKIVEGFGGKIWAESNPGKGSIFYFTVPII